MDGYDDDCARQRKLQLLGFVSNLVRVCRKHMSPIIMRKVEQMWNHNITNHTKNITNHIVIVNPSPNIANHI